MIPYSIIVIAAAIGVVPVAVWLLIVFYYTRSYRQSAPFVMAVFFWGVVSAIPASLLEIIVIEKDSSNQIIQMMSRFWSFSGMEFVLSTIISALGVALIEEFSKFSCLVISVRHKKLFSITDGLVFGGIIGLAFAVTENGVYFASALNNLAENSFSSMIVLRFILSTSAHIIYSGLLGLFLAQAYFEKSFLKRIFYIFRAFFIPVLIHFVFNYLLTTSLGWIVVLIIFGGIYWLWRAYYLYLPIHSRRLSV